MAKATELSADLVNPTARALPPRQLVTTKPAKREASPVNDALVQVRCTSEQRRAIKAAALAADKNISEFMLSLFDSHKQGAKA